MPRLTERLPQGGIIGPARAFVEVEQELISNWDPLPIDEQLDLERSFGAADIGADDGRSAAESESRRSGR